MEAFNVRTLDIQILEYPGALDFDTYLVTQAAPFVLVLCKHPLLELAYVAFMIRHMFAPPAHPTHLPARTAQATRPASSGPACLRVPLMAAYVFLFLFSENASSHKAFDLAGLLACRLAGLVNSVGYRGKAVARVLTVGACHVRLGIRGGRGISDAMPLFVMC